MIVPMGSLTRQLERLPAIFNKQYGWDIKIDNLKIDILKGRNELHLIDKDLVLIERQYLPNTEIPIIMCIVAPQSGKDISSLLLEIANRDGYKCYGIYIPTAYGCKVEIQEIV
jgi:hypothetical protein